MIITVWPRACTTKTMMKAINPGQGGRARKPFIPPAVGGNPFSTLAFMI
jgi:hypothetical protein